MAGEFFRTCPDRPWGPPSLLLNGYWVFPGVMRPGRGVGHPLRLAPRLKKEYSYTSTPPLGFRGLFNGDLYLYANKLCFSLSRYSRNSESLKIFLFTSLLPNLISFER